MDPNPIRVSLDGTKWFEFAPEEELKGKLKLGDKQYFVIAELLVNKRSLWTKICDFFDTSTYHIKVNAQQGSIERTVTLSINVKSLSNVGLRSIDLFAMTKTQKAARAALFLNAPRRKALADQAAELQRLQEICKDHMPLLSSAIQMRKYEDRPKPKKEEIRTLKAEEIPVTIKEQALEQMMQRQSEQQTVAATHSIKSFLFKIGKTLESIDKAQLRLYGDVLDKPLEDLCDMVHGLTKPEELDLPENPTREERIDFLVAMMQHHGRQEGSDY